MFKTIAEEAESCITEKKSKFIANIFEVQSVEQAEKILEAIRKKYHDARHNCYVYRILDGDNIIEKQSDDGEPSGTAGAPMLNILKKKELVNVVGIVTRYFGGILLGTGGLVRAYSEALIKAIEEAKEIEKEKGYLVEVINEYDKQKEFEYFCENNKIKIVSKEYKDKIKYLIEISEEKYAEVLKESEGGIYQKIPYEIKERKYISTHK